MMTKNFIRIKEKTGIYCSRKISVNIELIKQVVQELSQAGDFSILTPEQLAAGTPAIPVLALDGDHHQHSANELRLAGVEPNFHLVLSELGITLSKDEDPTQDEINLVKDAIEACCTTPDMSPKFNCPCSRVF